MVCELKIFNALHSIQLKQTINTPTEISRRISLCVMDERNRLTSSIKLGHSVAALTKRQVLLHCSDR